MKQMNHFEWASVAGALSSIAGALTLERAGVIAGIVTALVTCAANVAYMIRKDRREERALDAQLGGKP
jgi:protein-S-isoprenylcysteine O-methyltransferase Ste14